MGTEPHLDLLVSLALKGSIYSMARAHKYIVTPLLVISDSEECEGGWGVRVKIERGAQYLCPVTCGETNPNVDMNHSV